MTRRRVLVVFALTASLLLLSMPTAVASQTAVASKHTTAEDFRAGTITGGAITGSGTSAEVTAFQAEETNPPINDPFPYGAGHGDYGDALAQSFIAKAPDLSQFSVWLREDQSPGEVRVAIVPDNNGNVDFDNRLWESGVVSPATSWEKFTFGPDVSLTAGEKYYILIDGTVSGSGHTDARQASGKSSSGEAGLISSDGGSTFESWSSTDDIAFSVVYSTNTAEYVGANHSVEGATEMFADISMSGGTATIEAQAWSGSAWTTVNSATVSSSGNHSLSVSGQHSKYRTRVEFSRSSSSATASLEDEGVLFTARSPAIAGGSASPRGPLTEAPDSLSVSVRDPDFGTSQGDSVTARFYRGDGTLVGTDSTAANGTVSTSLSGSAGGTNAWYVTIRDEYGAVQNSSLFAFEVPSEMHIRPERNESKLIDGPVDITVRLYAEERTISRTVSDGTVNLTGVPVDQPIVATTSADGWVDRRVLIRDIYRQQSVFLLNKSATTVSNTFSLTDKSGSYPPADSTLEIQRALNATSDEGLVWRTIAGDYFAADSRFPATLQYNARYRIMVQNEQGQTRVLGTYIPQADGPRELVIGDIIWDPPSSEGVVANATFNASDQEVVVRYLDTAGNTTSLTVRVYRQGQRETPIQEQTYGSSQELKAQYAVPNSDSAGQLVVEIDAERTGGSGANYHYKAPVGGVASVGIPVDPRWLTLGAQTVLVATAGLVAGVMPRSGGVVVVPLAFGLVWLGWLTISPAALGFGGIIALLGAVQIRR